MSEDEDSDSDDSSKIPEEIERIYLMPNTEFVEQKKYLKED